MIRENFNHERLKMLIYNNLDAQVGFQRDVYWTTEDSASVQVCVVSSTALHDDIIVR